MAPRWGGLRPEPYDPDARDADGDGIVQEQTAWERPVGTNLVDELGRAITRGSNVGARPRGMRVVDSSGNDVDYTPTYARPGAAPGTERVGGTTALADHGAGSLKERGIPSLGEGLGKREASSVRAITNPNPEPPKTEKPVKPDVSTGSDRSPVAVPDNPEFHGVTRLDDRGFGNPKWNEFQKWSDQYGVTVRGTPLKWDDDKVPETLYHVSPAIKKIREDGVLKAAGEGGLGGDDRDRIVSMTTSRETAEQILDDMKLVRDVGRVKNPEEVLDVLRADASRHGIELSDEKIRALRRYAEDRSSAALNSYLWSRDTLGGPGNPLFFDLDVTMTKLADLEDDDFGIVKVDRKDLNNGALITDFDLGEGNLEEIRSYGDVKISPDRIEAVKPAGRPSTPEKPDAPKSKIADNYRQAKVFNGKDWQKTLKDTSDEVKAEVVKRHKRHKENPAARFDDAAEGKDDARLGTLAAHQGFDGKPTVGDSAEEMRDRSGRSGGPEVLFRGVSGLGETPASVFTDQFRNGDLWNGYGMTGGGTYLSKEEQIAISFSGRKRGKSSAVMVMELDPEDIRTATHDDLLEVQRRIDNYIFHEFTKKNRDLSLDEEFLEAVAVDLGMVATFLGYDAMYDGPQQSVVLYNRTAVKVAPNDL